MSDKAELKVLGKIVGTYEDWYDFGVEEIGFSGVVLNNGTTIDTISINWTEGTVSCYLEGSGCDTDTPDSACNLIEWVKLHGL